MERILQKYATLYASGLIVNGAQLNCWTLPLRLQDAHRSETRANAVVYQTTMQW